MHSKVFQLEKDNEVIEDSPLTDMDLIGDYDSNSFVGTIADYVSDECDRDKSFERLVDYLGDSIYKIEVTKTLEEDGKGSYESITFKKGFKESYFKNRLKALKEYSSSMTLEAFIDPFSVYVLNRLIEDKHTYYIYENTGGWSSIDSFVRSLPNEDETYYCGEVLDYHY